MGLYEIGIIIIIAGGCAWSMKKGYDMGYNDARWEYVKEKLHGAANPEKDGDQNVQEQG